MRVAQDGDHREIPEPFRPILPIRFREGLTKAEITLLDAILAGIRADCSPPFQPQEADDTAASKRLEQQNRARSIRANLIEWLCTDPEALKQFHTGSGIDIKGAIISGNLDLSRVTVSLILYFTECRLQDVFLYSAKVGTIGFERSTFGSLLAESVSISGRVELSDATSLGIVVFDRATIRDDVTCARGKLGTDDLAQGSWDGFSVSFAEAEIGGSAFFNAFSAKGMQMTGTKIARDLTVNGILYGQEHGSLRARDAHIAGDFLIDEVTILRGPVVLDGADIQGETRFTGAIFENHGSRVLTAQNAHFSRSVYFDEKCKVDGPISLNGAHITGDLDWRQPSTTPGGTTGDTTYTLTSNLNGLMLEFSRAEILGSVQLGKGSSMAGAGAVTLEGAHIFGDLVCKGLKLRGEGIHALQAGNSTIDGEVKFTEQFVSHGEVSLVAARFGRGLVCDNAHFTNNGSSSLTLDLAEIKGPVTFMGGTTVYGDSAKVGAASLRQAEIGGNLEFRDSKFMNPVGVAIDAERAHVSKEVSFEVAFSASGGVDLDAIRIDTDLECVGSFESLSTVLAEVRGTIRFGNFFSATGGVNLSGTKIGDSLDCSRGRIAKLDLSDTNIKQVFRLDSNQAIGELNLRNATTGTIDSTKIGWPLGAKLHLDGFTYSNISSDLKDDAEFRKSWLPSGAETSFSPQPYRQLAKVLRDLGDKDAAKQVMYELEIQSAVKQRRNLGRISKLGRYAEDVGAEYVYGFGYYPIRAVGTLAILAAFGWVIYRRASVRNAMAPREKDAYNDFHSGSGLPKYYPPFNPLIYTLENCVPLVKLGQDDKWQPDPVAPLPPEQPEETAGLWYRGLRWISLHVIDPFITPSRLRCLRWIMIVLGWLLATFFVAGVSGILKTD